MLKDVIKYVNYFMNETKLRHPHINVVILKSALVYQYLYQKHFNENISIDNVLEINHNEIGLLGPGNSYLTWFLERLLGWSDVLHVHSILHDDFGRFYCKYRLDRGYTYVLSEDITPNFIKKNPICGQITGIIYCCCSRLRLNP